MNDGPPKLLVVDDVGANLLAVEAVLSGLPCELVAARSGEEGLRMLLKQRFAALLLDVQMPEMDGYEVAQHVRRHAATKELPIIFLTAEPPSEESISRGYGSGAVDYLFKPISPVVLRSKVRVFLELYEGRRQAEETLRELTLTQAQLVQSAKLASLGELVAGVAHEINNPLAFVRSHLGTVTQGLAGLREALFAHLTPEQAQVLTKCLTRLDQTGEGLVRISELVTQLRNFARLDEGARKAVNLRESIDSVLMILGHRLNDSYEVALDLDGPNEVECYPGPLNIALMNLVSNAIDALDGAGHITIRSRADDDDLVLEVADDGPGIPDAIIGHIFEPFFTTKPEGKGTGLGLSIAHSIAKKHEGSLSVTSVPGHTAFTLRIPSERPPGASHTSPSDAGHLATKA